LIEAYRRHVDNPHAAKPSDTWSRWSSQFAWHERAAAYDRHLDWIRERSIEKAIEEEAERYAREIERTRYRTNELMTLGYERAMEWLEDSECANEQLRAGDVIKIIQLHLDATIKLGGGDRMAPNEGNWEEDDAEINRIVEEVDAAAEAEESAEGLKEGEEDSEEDEDEQR
jgi:hypothetical protein